MVKVYSLTSAVQGLWSRAGSGDTARLTLLAMEDQPGLDGGGAESVFTVKELREAIAEMA